MSKGYKRPKYRVFSYLDKKGIVWLYSKRTKTYYFVDNDINYHVEKLDKSANVLSVKNLRTKQVITIGDTVTSKEIKNDKGFLLKNFELDFYKDSDKFNINFSYGCGESGKKGRSTEIYNLECKNPIYKKIKKN